MHLFRVILYFFLQYQEKDPKCMSVSHHLLWGRDAWHIGLRLSYSITPEVIHHT